MKPVLVGFALAAAVGVGTVACARPSDDVTPPAAEVRGARVSGTGTVRYIALEGGFFAIVGSDGKTYDPQGGLPAALRHDGLRVSYDGYICGDCASIHMVGDIVVLTRVSQL
ncbi:MAG TPA: hypothetical protein VFJ74_10710 [Gemmatimonadaceae bacterium]|nr:hypothetical protein [Gemmatimonadaceae bacterium]